MAEQEEDNDIENQLIQHITNHNASMVVSEPACDGDVTVQDVQKALTGCS